ncbi:MAG: DUF3306 domain-containing protein [Pseudomonadota bacterium]
MSRPERPDTREDGFLGRWSRLKREGGDASPEEAPAESAAPVEAAPEEPPKSDAEILEELGLPEPEGLKEGDDFAAFMKEAVPEHLRRRALRRLWTSNPVLANLDELLDYGDDFTDAATVVENLATGWKVGRGYAVPEPEEAPAGSDVATAAEPADEETGPEMVEGDEGSEAAEADLTSEGPDAEPAPLPEPEEIAAAPRQRMRFMVPGDG